MKNETIRVSAGLIDSLKKDEERRAALLKAKPKPSRSWLKGVWGIPAFAVAGTVGLGLVLLFVFKEGGGSTERAQQGDPQSTVTSEQKAEVAKAVGTAPAQMNLRQMEKWKLIDKNGDERITLEELKLSQGVRKAGKDTPSLFTAVDKDHDGFISSSEFVVLVGPVQELKIRKPSN